MKRREFINLLGGAAAAWPFVINLQAARALGIDVPPSILLLADEVIE